MRPSNRTRILEAAVQVVQRDGVTALTFDSVAAETELTRGGLLYHFASREALVAAIHQHMADSFEARLRSVAGKPVEECSVDERLAAYAVVCGEQASRAELQLVLEASTETVGTMPWEGVIDRWVPDVPDKVDDFDAMARFVARLAADGLWMYEALTDRTLAPEFRKGVASFIAAMDKTESGRDASQ